MSEDRWLYGWALGYAAVGAASLLLPLYALALGGDAVLIGLMASTAAFAGVPGAIVWGRLAARSGRKRVFLLVALGSTAAVLAGAAVLPSITRSPWPLLALNAVLWFVVAASAPVLNLVVVDGVPEREWNARIALLNEYQGYGWLGGLIAGAVWMAVTPFGAVLAQRLFLALSALSTVVAFVLLRLWYPRPVRTSARRFAQIYARLPRRGWGTGRTVRPVPFGPSRLYWGLRTLDVGALRERLNSSLGVYLVGLTCFFVGFSVFFGPLPAYLTAPQVGLGSDAVFVLFVLSSAGSAITYGPAGALSARLDAQALQTGALAGRAVAFPAVALVGAASLPPNLLFGVLGVLFAFVGVTWAVIAVTATGLVTRLAPKQARGDALGAYTALSSLGGGLGSALGGVLASSTGYVAAFVVAAVVVVAGAGLALLARRAGPSPAEALTG